MKILLIEDNPADVRLLAERIREADGDSRHSLDHVPRLLQALTRLSEDHYDLVLLDLDLPDAKGVEAVEIIENTPCKAPIVVLSGQDRKELALEAVKSGAQDYIPKDQIDGATLLRAMGYAIERNRILRKMREREHFLSTLHGITQEALKTTDLESMLNLLANQLGDLFQADGCYIALWDDRRGYAIPSAAYGALQEQYTSMRPNPEEVTMAGSVLEAGRPLAAEDVTDSPYISPRIVNKFPSRSLLGLPLIAGAQKLGAVLVSYEEPHRFSKQELVRGEQAASLVSLAVAKMQSLASERKRAEELGALQQASLQLTSSLDLQTILDTVLQNALSLVEGKDAHIFLYDGKRLKFASAQWADGKRKKPFAQPREGGLTYQVARSGEQRIVSDMANDPLYQNTGWEGGIIGLPLKVGERVLGVMNMAFEEPHYFDENELRALQLLAAQASVAVENARLFAEVQRMSITDHLTGLHNRRGFFTLGRQQLIYAARKKDSLILLYLDLDDFKRINDTLGHATGDQALAATARIIEDTFRRSDIKARIGGDEFAVLGLESGTGGSNAIMARLRRNLKKFNEDPARPYRISFSIGSAVYSPGMEISLEALLARADAKMYEEKERSS